MELIKIKKELLQKRCEICHQSDVYDAQENICQRCKNVKPKTGNQEKSLKPVTVDEIPLKFAYVGIEVGLINAFVTTIIISFIEKFSFSLFIHLVFFSILLMTQGYLVGMVAGAFWSRGWLVSLLIPLTGIIWALAFLVIMASGTPSEYLVYPFCLFLLNSFIMFIIYVFRSITGKTDKLQWDKN